MLDANLRNSAAPVLRLLRAPHQDQRLRSLVHPLQRVEADVNALWDAEQAPWQSDAVPRIRESLVDHLRALKDEATLNSSDLRRRIDAIKRDRYKWDERVMDGSVPADIGREKQDQLMRQLAGLEQELKALERAGIDSEGTLNVLIDRLSDPGMLYRDLGEPDRRRYNQAWFSRVYIDAIDLEPESVVTADLARTPLSAALDESRQYADAKTARNEETGPGGPVPSYRLALTRSGF